MKKYLFILISIVLTSITGFGQTNIYHPFPDSDGIWNYHYYSQSSNNYYSYGIFGDTVLNSLTYKKLYLHNQDIFAGDSVMNVGNSYLIGGIREDSAKRIYCYNLCFSGVKDSIWLLYDFSKKVGDTIHLGSYWSGYAYEYLVVDSIDSVFVNDSYRKRFHMYYDKEIWIEGIGSTRDLLSVIKPYTTCLCVNEIVCYKYGDTTYYLNPKYHDCYPFLGNSIEDVPKPERVVVSPNPIVSQAFLTTDIILKNALLTFYTSYGQMIKQIKNISGQTITIDKDNLPAGLYFIRLTQGNKLLWTGKIEISNN